MELKQAFKYRNVWIGMAMLWIVYYHSQFWIDSVVFRSVKSLGYGGVDICLFASGIGCYYSLERDPDIFRFLKRRIKRLAPAYLCFIIPWMQWKGTITELPVWAVIGNLLGIGTLASWEYHFNWYIGGLVVFYLCLPFLKQITDSCKKVRQDFLVGLFLIAVSVSFWNAEGKNLIIVSRLPVLYAGTVCAKMAKQGYILQKRDYWMQLVTVTVGMVLILLCDNYLPDLLWTYGLKWYPFIMIAPGFCIFMSLAAAKMEKIRYLCRINQFLQTVGRYSFELYLVHGFLYEGLMWGVMERYAHIPHNLLWLMTLPFVAAGTFLLNRIAGCLSHLLEKQWNKKSNSPA